MLSNMSIVPPPRKNPPTVHFVTKQDKSSLEILLQLGISKHRAYVIDIFFIDVNSCFVACK